VHLLRGYFRRWHFISRIEQAQICAKPFLVDPTRIQKQQRIEPVPPQNLIIQITRSRLANHSGRFHGSFQNHDDFELIAFHLCLAHGPQRAFFINLMRHYQRSHQKQFIRARVKP